MAEHQFSLQETPMSPALGPRANYNGDGTYNSFTNSVDSIPNLYDHFEIEQVRPRHVASQYNCGMGDTFRCVNNVSIDCIMVHFINWLYYHKHMGNFVYIVYIKPLKISAKGANFIIFKWTGDRMLPYFIVTMCQKVY